MDRAKNIHQDRVATFRRARHMGLQPEQAVLDLCSEVGELAKEVLLTTDYGRQNHRTFRENLRNELADVYIALLTAADALGVQLSAEFESRMLEYEQRFRLSPREGQL